MDTDSMVLFAHPLLSIPYRLGPKTFGDRQRMSNGLGVSPHIFDTSPL